MATGAKAAKGRNARVAGIGGITRAMEPLSRNRDIAFAAVLCVVLAVLFVPLPPILLDVGFAASFAVSILVLMVSLWVVRPLEFNSFPTLLLVVTMMRLALSVASTRLILTMGQHGTDAAGHVIEGIANFVVGGDFLIGSIIFIILVAINFIVITKGSTRIAEVSARFSLDAMPGKQMAIDADLSAGLIDEDEARRRRKDVEGESNFFGAMDGAAKFVRGDAIASLIIILVNIIGGLLIGVLRHGMGLADALQTYTILTIGDGLVAQIPALIVSIAAGLIVTKGATEGATNEAVIGQLGGSPKALFVSGGIVAALGLLPGFPLVIFLLLGSSLACLGLFSQKSIADQATRREVEARKQVKSAEDEAEDNYKVDTIRLELGTGLIAIIGGMESALPGKIKSLRNLFADEYGFFLPSVRIKDSLSVDSSSYRIVIQGVTAATGYLKLGGRLVIDPGGEVAKMPGERVKEPTFGLPALWIDQSKAAEAERLGYTVVDPESVIVTHLTEVIKDYLPEFLTFKATQDLVARLDRDYQKLVNDMPGHSPVITLQNVLKRLLAERVPIKNLSLIIEGMAEVAPTIKNPALMTERVRQKLSGQICQLLVGADGFLPVVTLGPRWTAEFASSIKIQGEETVSTMSPDKVQNFIHESRIVLQKYAKDDIYPAILVAPEARYIIRTMLERVSALNHILAFGELHRKVRLKNLAQIGD